MVGLGRNMGVLIRVTVWDGRVGYEPRLSWLDIGMKLAVNDRLRGFGGD